MGNCHPKAVDNLPAAAAIDAPRSPGRNNGGDRRERLLDTADFDGGAANVQPSGRIVVPNLRVFTLLELKCATRNFRPDSLLGEGGFGRVFKGFVDEKTLAPSRAGIGIPIAVKKSNPDSDQGLREWQTEVEFLGKFSHPNLVKLIGYCWEDAQFLLVYEYMEKGSLANHLFRNDAAAEKLPWNLRMKIAICAARGLAFLHSTEKKVIYRDFKASNILLDGEFNAKLSDFGLAKFGPEEGDTHVTTKVIGTCGYAAPEYLATGHLYVKSDVYGFGVVLLELLTGLPVLDLTRPSARMNLVDWIRPRLSDRNRVRKIVDPRIIGQCPSKATFATAQLILKCLQQDLKQRATMDEVLQTLENISGIETKEDHHRIIRRNANSNNSNLRSSARPTFYGNNGPRSPQFTAQ